MKKLIIVESPSKAKTIEKYLGGDYVVEASGGHVRDLPEHGLGVDIENNFAPRYEIYEKKEDTVKKLKGLVKKSSEIYLATDPDREGEAISWHLKSVLGIEGGNNRIVFNEISKKAVNVAIQNPRDIDMCLVDAQQARRVLDRLVGYKISPVLSRKIRSNLSAGRVQSAALKMIIEREREIRAFKPEEYWNLFAFLLKLSDPKGKPFKTSFEDIDKKKYVIPNKEALDKILADIRDEKFTVDSVKKGTSKSRPQPPFTTSTMQQDASKKLSMSSPMSMQIAQQLYEGVEVEGEEGLTALVTYIRTDSVRVSPDMQAETKKYITETFGAEYAPQSFNVYASKKGAQDAHEAIRPISLERTPQSLYNKISKYQYRLYKLIYERYLASQMTDAVYNTLNVRVAVPSKSNPGGTYGFRIKGRSVLFKGFTVLYVDAAVSEANEAEENAETNEILPDFREGEELLLKELKYEQKFTKPPSRFTDATLVKAMEENGIGRPSTYATVISVLNKREYTVKEEKSIVPTQLGETVCDYLVKYFSDIIDVEFTAKMEEDLDKIEDGGKEWQAIIAKFYPDFLNKVTFAAQNGDSVKMPPEITDVVCDKCGARMVIRDGKYGKFLACPAYPACKNVKPYDKPVAVCPKCGKDVYKKKTKAGKFFYGCSGYPDCDFLSWDIPAPYPCPECGGFMKISTAGGVKKYMCTNSVCKHREIIVEEKEDEAASDIG